MRLFAFFLILAGFGSSAAAQYQCNLPTTNEWLRGEVYREGPDSEIGEDLIFPVSINLPRAIALLKKDSAVAMSVAQARQFAGPDLKLPVNRRLKPYLVRAVFPSGDPTTGLSWGPHSRLRVFAEGLGCNLYVKHPIIVFLDRRPKQVFVVASGAL